MVRKYFERCGAALITVVTLVTCSIANAQQKIAIASMAGDSFLLNVYESQTSSRVNGNRLERIALGESGLNGFLTLRAERELMRMCKSCATVLLASNPSISAIQAEVVSGKAEVDRLIVPLLDAAKQQDATHLLIITRHRGDVMPKFVEGYVGTGKVDGLGFFIDNSFKVRNVNTGEHAQGYMSLFSYLRFMLIDIKQEKIIRENHSASNRIYANYKNKGESFRAWDTLTAEEKAKALQSMAAKDIASHVPELFQGLPTL